jgi:hypothetical protein
LTPKQVLQKLKTAPLQDVPEAERAFVQKVASRAGRVLPSRPG